jgi:Spy/CpxP family protein refolding chaperone
MPEGKGRYIIVGGPRGTAEGRSEAARKAALARTTPDAHIKALIESAARPTPEQAAKLRAWLPPVPDDGDEVAS